MTRIEKHRRDIKLVEHMIDTSGKWLDHWSPDTIPPELESIPQVLVNVHWWLTKQIKSKRDSK